MCEVGQSFTHLSLILRKRERVWAVTRFFFLKKWNKAREVFKHTLLICFFLLAGKSTSLKLWERYHFTDKAKEVKIAANGKVGQYPAWTGPFMKAGMRTQHAQGRRMVYPRSIVLISASTWATTKQLMTFQSSQRWGIRWQPEHRLMSGT